MARKRSAKQKIKRAQKRLAELPAGYCGRCQKVIWPTREAAMQKVKKMKTEPGAKQPWLLDCYRCPHGLGIHIGHNYVLGLVSADAISLCTGEHK